MDIFSHNNMTPVSFRRYLNKVEVCHFLRISLPTLNRWIRNGDFPPPHKIGQYIVGWPPEIVTKGCNENKQAPGACGFYLSQA